MDQSVIDVREIDVARSLGNETRAILLAGTYRWNDSWFRDFPPRPLLPVAQEPLISHTLRWLCSAGVTEITICANDGDDPFRRAVAQIPSAITADYRTDLMPRGPAGCLRDAGTQSEVDTYVVVEGAVIPLVNLTEIVAKHRASRATLTVVANPPSDGGFGRQESTPAGIYVCDRRVLDFVPAFGFQDIKEGLIPRLYQARERILVAVAERPSPRVLNMRSYLAVNHWVVPLIVEHTFSETGSYVRNGDQIVHRSSEVDPRAVLIGPVLIGPSVRIEAGATIVGPTAIGADTVVSRDALVSRSVLWQRCRVGRQGLVDNCVLADEAVVTPRQTLLETVRVRRWHDHRSWVSWMSRPTRPDEPVVASPLSELRATVT